METVLTLLWVVVIAMVFMGLSNFVLILLLFMGRSKDPYEDDEQMDALRELNKPPTGTMWDEDGYRPNKPR